MTALGWLKERDSSGYHGVSLVRLDMFAFPSSVYQLLSVYAEYNPLQTIFLLQAECWCFKGLSFIYRMDRTKPESFSGIQSQPLPHYHGCHVPGLYQTPHPTQQLVPLYKRINQAALVTQCLNLQVPGRHTTVLAQR